MPGAEGYTEPAELPDYVIIAMLRREVLLTEAKLHALDYELVTAERKLRQLRSQLRQVRIMTDATVPMTGRQTQ